MLKVLRNLKDRLFIKLVEGNQHVLKEYQNYKWSISGRENKLKSWSYIALLNIKHRWILSNVSEGKKLLIPKKSRTAKLPYLDGPESSVLDRPTPMQLAKRLLKYDIISFDIFDTLILRPFAQPHDLFMLLGEKHNISDFITIRRQAEHQARKLAKEVNGNTEVTIYDIYEIIERKTGLNKEIGVQTEFETEMNLCFANPYMKEVYNILLSQGKKMIAVSDMYLTKEMITELLNINGYKSFEDIFVSSEYNGSKRDKNLYKVVLHKYKGKNMVHIGDNYQTDIVHANEMGIKTEYYKNVHEVGNKFRADGMSELIGSVYSGIVNTHLHNGTRKYSPYYEYGFIYGGLYVLGFCSWIHDYAKTKQIDKVLFLSRDGEIYRKVFNYLYDDVDNEYVYWSRIANTKYTVDKNRDEFLTRIVRQKSIGVLDITIGSLLRSLDLEEMIHLLADYGLNENDLIHTGNTKLLEDFFTDNWDMLVEIMTRDMYIVEEYFRYLIKNSKKIAIVDVGWLGSGAEGIKHIIKNKMKLDCQIYSLVAASRYWNHVAPVTNLQTKALEPYIFSRMYNRNLYDTHSKTNKGTNNIFFELFTQAPYPSFSGFSKDHDDFKMDFDIPETENYQIIKEIHEGIFDFVKLYYRTFKDYSYLFNISGYDAYLPFRMIIRDLKFIKSYFSDLRYARSVLGDAENQSIEKLGDILEKAGC